ncbi:MAG: LiaF-related protein [Longimicrobiales bacterium]|nr:LiaF-related protein [Longimicrobiales bacterium]
MTRHPGLSIAILVALTALPSPAPVAAQEMKSVTISRALTTEKALDVVVTFGAGELLLRRADRGTLYALDLRYDERAFVPLADFDGHRLEVGLETHDRQGNLDLDDGRSGRLDLRLAPDVPMDLRLKFGAGRSTIDLGGLALRDLDIETGASESELDVSRPNSQVLRRAQLDVGAAEFTALRLGNLNLERLDVTLGVGDLTLDFSGALERDIEVTIDMGLGSLELRLPEAVGLRLEKSSFLTSFDTEGFERRDGVYYSSNWDDASRRIDVTIDAAFGSIRIVRTP